MPSGGRKLNDRTYSDARAYTILELLRSYDLPDDFPFPAWALDEDKLLREVLGEAFAHSVWSKKFWRSCLDKKLLRQ